MLAAAVAGQERAIVLGDFNAVPDAPELAPMWAQASDTDTRCQASSIGTCEATTDWNSKFDYVFLRGIAPLLRRVQPTDYSDHHLLYTDLDPA